MQKFEFRNFTPTPGEKHAGIAEIKVNGETPLILRFKITPRKDGAGFFPNIASYKMPGRPAGEEYDECFMLDSRSDDDSCKRLVMQGFNAWHAAQQPSVFAATAPRAPAPYPYPDLPAPMNPMQNASYQPSPMPSDQNLPF